jgi:hypothetical protein
MLRRIIRCAIEAGMMNFKKMMSRILVLSVAVSSFMATAAGSKAPGNGDFQNLNTVKSNRNYVLRSDSKDGKPQPFELADSSGFHAN